jgi:hypothetical protein
LFLRSQVIASDRTKCCQGGYIILDDQAAFTTLKPLPLDILHLLFANIKHFSANSALYNRMLSIADTQLENGRGGKIEQRRGDSAYTINGTVTYYIRRDALIGRGGLSYFTFDGLAKLKSHGDSVNSSQSSTSSARYGSRVQDGFVAALFNGLRRDNPFCAELKRTGDRVVRADESGTPVVQLSTALTATINNENKFFEVAAFTADNLRYNRSFRYKLKGASVELKARDKMVEPLVFPLLFWYGESGYEKRKIGSSIELNFEGYMRARMLIPEPGWSLPCRVPPGGIIPGWKPEHVGAPPPANPLNRFQLLSRVAQAYTVETLSRQLDYRLTWHREAGHSTVFGFKHTAAIAALREAEAGETQAGAGSSSNSDSESSQEEDDTVHAREQEAAESSTYEEVSAVDAEHHEEAAVDPQRETFSHSSPSFLSDSFTGGPRHLKALAKNALVVVSELGAPSAFITLTCNAKDPAIVCRLLPDQSAFDRPEVVVQVWKAQLNAFLQNLRHGKYLGGKVKYIMYVIEYQVSSHRTQC